LNRLGPLIATASITVVHRVGNEQRSASATALGTHHPRIEGGSVFFGDEEVAVGAEVSSPWDDEAIVINLVRFQTMVRHLP
jgi:hypothetical protein